uniref:Uncharacterized protein n=1 Tax=Athene cunicularia TaxID=194338 RepID=A0A663LZN8_ATHCN
MTVTELGWEGCLAATKAVRSYVSPNFGFQQQLQEYEVTLLQEVQGGRLLREASGCLDVLGSGWASSDSKPFAFRGRRQEQVLMERFSSFLPKMTRSSRF